MSEQTDGQQGAAPATARECAELALASVAEHGVYGTHAVDDAAALIDAYADRVASATRAEARLTKECPGCAALRKRIEALEKAMKQAQADTSPAIAQPRLYGGAAVKSPPFRTTW